MHTCITDDRVKRLGLTPLLPMSDRTLTAASTSPRRAYALTRLEYVYTSGSSPPTCVISLYSSTVLREDVRDRGRIERCETNNKTYQTAGGGGGARAARRVSASAPDIRKLGMHLWCCCSCCRCVSHLPRARRVARTPSCPEESAWCLSSLQSYSYLPPTIPHPLKRCAHLVTDKVVHTVLGTNTLRMSVEENNARTQCRCFPCRRRN